MTFEPRRCRHGRMRRWPVAAGPGELAARSRVGSLRTALAVGAVVAAAAVALTPALVKPAAAEPRPWAVRVRIGPVAESDGRAIVNVITACTNEIHVRFTTGQSAPPVSNPDWSERDSYDGRGPAAEERFDYVARTADFALSYNNPLTVEVPIVDDERAEDLEHVKLLFELTFAAGVMYGDKATCEGAAVPVRGFVESAFTIADDDDASAEIAGSSAGGIGTPGSAAGSRAKRGSQAASGPSLGDGTNPRAADAEEQLPEADGLVLIGAALSRDNLAADHKSQSEGSGTVVALVVATGAAVSGRVWRRRHLRW